MNADDNKHTIEDADDRIILLRESVRRSFPSKVYTGDVTPYDKEVVFELREDQADLDEEQFLYRTLRGRRWTDVPREFIETHPVEYGLLTDEAFVAFLPAWLICSLENIDGENQIRDSLVYAFSETMQRFRLLNPEQRRTVRAMLAEFAQRDADPSVSKRAVKALKLVDLFEQYGEPGYLYKL